MSVRQQVYTVRSVPVLLSKGFDMQLLQCTGEFAVCYGDSYSMSVLFCQFCCLSDMITETFLKPTTKKQTCLRLDFLPCTDDDRNGNFPR